jgi:hypothetical protein
LSEEHARLFAFNDRYEYGRWPDWSYRRDSGDHNRIVVGLVVRRGVGHAGKPSTPRLGRDANRKV